MTAQLVSCQLACSSSSADSEETAKSGEMDRELPIFSALAVGAERHQEGVVCAAESSTPTDAESGIFSGESELCVAHEAELDWFCGTEQKLICSHCAVVGACQGHSVSRLADRVTAVRVSLGSSSYH